VLDAISADVRQLWSILVPQTEIKDIRLVTPEDADKAIDVELSFHGVTQRSPRLTLSEGRRNALGLCIFLALSRQNQADHPIILDDVVTSLDREHRSRVATLLEQEFYNRQVLLLTHDREWFFELRHLLAQARWQRRQMRAWTCPKTGIQLVDGKVDELADARATIKDDPGRALRDARRVMDVWAQHVAEILEVPVPFRRGEKNDRRTCGELIPAVAGRAKKNLQLRDIAKASAAQSGYSSHTEAINKLTQVTPIIVAWANRAVHQFQGTASEAHDLLDACEAACAALMCDHCGTPVWYLKCDQDDYRRCDCGSLRWRL
jgi:hypothetical protein